MIVSARVTYFVVTPTMVQGRKRFSFVVSCFASKGGAYVATRRFGTIEKATAFTSEGRMLRVDDGGDERRAADRRIQAVAEGR